MKKKMLKTRKAASHAKAPHAALAKRCGCCGAAPCTCPAEHGHKP